MIEFDVNNQKLEILESSYLANKSHNYLELKFNFRTDDWLDKTIYCLAQSSKRETYQFAVVDDTVILPATILKGKHFKISLYGHDEEHRITTNQIRIKLAESGFTRSITPVEPVGKDVFTVIFEMLDSKLNIDDVDVILDENSTNPIANCIVTNKLNTKSDIGHTHTSNEVTGINEVAEIEIKKAYRVLKTKILTYGE